MIAFASDLVRLILLWFPFEITPGLDKSGGLWLFPQAIKKILLREMLAKLATTKFNFVELLNYTLISSLIRIIKN